MQWSISDTRGESHNCNSEAILCEALGHPGGSREGVFCTGIHVIPLMHGWVLFKTYQSYKNIRDSVISVCPSQELLPLGSLGPRTVSSSHIYTAPTDSDLKLPKVLIWTPVKAFLHSCWSRVFLSDYLLNYIYFLSKDIYYFFFKTMCLSCFFGKQCQEIKKTPNPWQTVPRNAEMCFFTLHLFNISLLSSVLSKPREHWCPWSLQNYSGCLPQLMTAL